MGAEEAGLDGDAGELPGNAQHLALVFAVESVAGFHFDCGDSLSSEAVDARLGILQQLFFACLASLRHGRPDAPASAGDLLVACALQAKLELLRAIAGEDQMRMTIDQARRQPTAGQIVPAPRKAIGSPRQVLAQPDPCDPARLGRNGAVFDGAIRRPAGAHGGEPAVNPKIVPHGFSALAIVATSINP